MQNALHPDDFVRGKSGGAIGGCNPFLPSTESHSYGTPLVYSIPMQSTEKDGTEAESSSKIVLRNDLKNMV